MERCEPPRARRARARRRRRPLDDWQLRDITRVASHGSTPTTELRFLTRDLYLRSLTYIVGRGSREPPVHSQTVPDSSPERQSVYLSSGVLGGENGRSPNLLCEAARSGGSYVWNRQRHLERVPASLPGPSWRLSIASSLLSSLREMHSHIRATTWLLTVTTHNHGAVTTTVGSSAPCSQTPLSLSAASLSGRTS